MQQQAYGDADYWDTRYAQDVGSFDWYQRYSDLVHLVHKHIPRAARVLMAGCGNAVISEDMVKDGYEEIVNIDISPVVIDAMQKKYRALPQLTYINMDARNMYAFQDDTFDAVFDKGLLDSLMCGANALQSAYQMLQEVFRILKPGGIYMLVTYGDPRIRMPHLEGPGLGWRILLYIIRKSQTNPLATRPNSSRALESCSRILSEPILMNGGTTLDSFVALDDPDLHYVYVCEKEGMPSGRKA